MPDNPFDQFKPQQANPFDQFKPAKPNPFEQFKPVAQAAPTAPAASPGILDPRSVKESLQRAITPSNQKVVSALAQEPGRMIEGLLNIPKKAFEASEEYRKGGEYNAAPIVDAALLGVGPSVAGARAIPTPRTGEAPKPPLPEAPKTPKPTPESPKSAALPGSEPRVNEFGHVSKDTFNYPIKDTKGDKVGEIEYINGTRHDADANAITIRAAGIDKNTARGQGLGTKAYKEIIDWAHDNGKDVYSSGSTNDLSDAVYERLKKQGYAVTKEGDTYKISPKKYTQGDLLEAQQVYREAVWRTKQGENNPAHEHFAAEAKEKLERIQRSLAEAPKPAPGAAATKPTEPPLAPGNIRFYHGTSYKDASGFTGSTFVTPHYQYARDYHGGPNNVLYTDMTREEAIKQGLYDEINNQPRNGSIDDGSTRLKPLEAAPEAPKPAESAPAPASGGGAGGPPPGKGLFDNIPAATPPIKEQVVNLSDELQRIKQSGVADRAEIGNRIAQVPKELRDKDLYEKFYHIREDPKKLAELTPQERALYDQHLQHLQPMRDEVTQLYNTIKKLGGEDMVDDPTHVHRIAMGHAPQYDTLSGEAANPVAGTRSLSKTTSALKDRKFYAIENDQGKRFVVSKDADGGVSVWKDGKPTKIKKEGSLEPGRGMEIGGQDWEIKQARTSEIEANSSVRYYKNEMLNTADALVRMREVARNLEFLEKTKASPWWLENATRVGGNKRIPAGWRQPKLPQLHDWFVNPKLANVLDDFYKPGLLDADSGLRKINQFAIGSIFWNPIPHIENVAAHWFTGRGWDWIKPGPIRHFATDAGRAIQAVVTQNKLYQSFLREGSGLVYGGVKNADFYQAMGKRFGMDIEKNWGAWHPIAKKLGMNKPGEFIAWWYGKMNNVLWAANDMFMMHRYLELQRKGMSSRAAIKEAEKHIPNYRIPPEVLGSRTVSQFLQEPGVTVFSRYHYGMWKSYMNMVADLAKGSTKEKIDALGNLAALGVLMYGIYPAVDYAIQKLTGDPKAMKLRRGSASIPQGLKDMYEGDTTFLQFLGNSITFAPITKEFAGDIMNAFWDRRPDVQKADDAAKALVGPYATARQFMDQRSGGRSTGRAAFDTLVGVKNTSERTERGKKIAKSIRDKQTRKYIQRLKKDVGGAVDKVKSVFGGAVE